MEWNKQVARRERVKVIEPTHLIAAQERETPALSMNLMTPIPVIGELVAWSETWYHYLQSNPRSEIRNIATSIEYQ